MSRQRAQSSEELLIALSGWVGSMPRLASTEPQSCQGYPQRKNGTADSSEMIVSARDSDTPQLTWGKMGRSAGALGLSACSLVTGSFLLLPRLSKAAVSGQ